MKRTLLLLLVLTLTMSGCVAVGIGTVFNSKTLHENFEYRLTGEKGSLFVENQTSYQYNKEEIVEKWGEPDTIFTEGDVEYWQYRQDRVALSGIIPIVILPIPLVLPWGEYDVVFGFKDDQLVSTVSQSARFQVAICGIVVFPGGADAGCGFDE